MAGRFTVTVAPAAERQLTALAPPIRTRIVRALLALETQPRPPACTKLQGAEDLYRIKAGEYRIIYRVQDRELVVLVLKVGPRKDIYRRLP